MQIRSRSFSERVSAERDDLHRRRIEFFAGRVRGGSRVLSVMAAGGNIRRSLREINLRTLGTDKIVWLLARALPKTARS
jgi:hypothetical protein